MERSSRWIVVAIALVVVAFGALLGALLGANEGPGPHVASASRTPLEGFGEVAATITDASGKTCEVCLLAAIDEPQRERGLMEVTDTDLGGYDGMIFLYPELSSRSFWMRNTPMPLSIAYFDADGELVSTADMAPCADRDDCPRYRAAAPFAYALEVPRGRLGALLVKANSTITLGARTCPLSSSVTPPGHTGSR